MPWPTLSLFNKYSDKNIHPSSFQDADNRRAYEDPDHIWDQDAAGQPGRVQLRGEGPGGGQGEGPHGYLLVVVQSWVKTKNQIRINVFEQARNWM